MRKKELSALKKFMEHALETLAAYEMTETFSDPIWKVIQRLDSCIKEAIAAAQPQTERRHYGAFISQSLLP